MESANIRNVVLVGHGGSGKTSLAEALLYVAGETTRLGRVDDGTAVLDHEPEEIDRKLSLATSTYPFQWKGKKVNLIDTPGYADFLGEAMTALRAADLAIFVVSAVDGVEVQTEALWRLAEEEGIARAVFVNKMDRERASFTRTLAELREAFGQSIAPFLIPIGAEASLAGVVDVTTSRAFDHPAGAKESTAGEIPPELADQVADLHVNVVEAVVETDDTLLEDYLETGAEPSRDRLVAAMHKGLVAGATYPVLCGSATTLVGVDLLADFITKYGPSPLERIPPSLEQGDLDISATGPVVAYVFKTFSDPYVGRVSLFRVFSGRLAMDDDLENGNRGGQGRMHNVFFMKGKDHEDTKDVVAGDIAGVAKVEVALSGDTLRTPGTNTVIRPVEMPRPTYAVAVAPRTTQDEEKLSTALQRMIEEDHTLRLERRNDTHQTILHGLGDTHLDVSLARMARRYGVDVDTSVPKVPYRETIGATAEAEGKHKKQSGGRGQFGVAFIRFEPLPRGTGYEFVDAIKGGSIPRQFIPAVDKGVQEAFDRGILAGFPVVDVRATVYDGKYHSVDSDELSFRMAGIQAVRSAAQTMRPILLEPIMAAAIRIPEDYMGDVIGDLNSKRGRVLGMDSDGHVRIVQAEVPQAEMMRYAIDLRSITGGRGSFEMEFHHYEEAPPNEAQRVIAAQQKEE